MVKYSIKTRCTASLSNSQGPLPLFAATRIGQRDEGPVVTVVRGVEHHMDLVEKVNGLRLTAAAGAMSADGVGMS